MNDLVKSQLEQVNEKKGVSIFSFEDTLFSTKINEEDATVFKEIPHGIRLLKSCSKIEHFVVIISYHEEWERKGLVKLINTSTGMIEGIDFVLCLFSDKAIISEESVNNHYTSIVSNWVGYCTGQNSKVSVGVSSNDHLISIMEDHNIKTVFCDENGTEVEEFCLLDKDKMPLDNKPDPKPAKKMSNKKSPDWQSDKIFDGDLAIEQAVLFPQYFKQIPKDWEFADIYRVDELFPINLPGASRLYHARKKLMIPGVRTGGKSAYKDVQEAVATLQGWLRDHAPRNESEA